MKISFHGAAGEVTGSCTLIESNKTKFLVDCGVFQGKEFFDNRNFDRFEFEAKEISFVLLTHAHLDHCGRLPKLFKEGFLGRVYCTPATRDFTELMLLDSARIIAEEAEKMGKPPLYSEADVIKIMANFEPIEYGIKKEISQEITVTCLDAGHILGSAIIEASINEDGVWKKLIFSGDLGNPPAPIVRDPEIEHGADLVFIESTYGGIVHESGEERINKLKSAVLDSIGQGGVLMIPAFSLERTQEVLYELNYLVESHQLPAVPVFVDSPLAIKAIEVYQAYHQYFDTEAKAMIAHGDNLFNFPGLRYTLTPQESREINHLKPPKIIIAGSGMCNGGRIPHHLKRYLGDEKNTLLIISYQAVNSLGREILDGAKKVMIHDEEVKVKAKVVAIGAYSSHADKPKLLDWAGQINSPKPQQFFVVHGEKENNLALGEAIKKQTGVPTMIAEYKKDYEF